MFELRNPSGSTGGTYAIEHSILSSPRVSLDQLVLTFPFSIPILAQDLSFDMLVNKALEEIVNNASAQFIDIIGKAADKAVDRHSNHVKDLQIPTSKDAGQQQAVADATAATDEGNSGDQPKQDAMEVKGTTAVVPMQSIRSEDKYGDAPHVKQEIF